MSIGFSVADLTFNVNFCTVTLNKYANTHVNYKLNLLWQLNII